MSTRRTCGIGAALVLLGGCALQPIVYHPNAPQVRQPTFPLRVVVPPFADATREKAERHKTLSIPLVVLNTHSWVNVTKAETSTAYFSPRAWGKALAAEMKNSGLFQDVVFEDEPQGPSADLILEGTVNESTLHDKVLGIIFAIVYVGHEQHFTFTLRARRSGEARPFWEGTARRDLKGASSSERLDAMLRGMMAEITQALVKGLETNRSAWSGPRPAATAPAPATGASVEEILRQINAH